MILQQANPPRTKSEQLAEGMSSTLMFGMLGITVLVGLVLLLMARRFTRHESAGGGTRTKTRVGSPWRESAARMEMPEADVKERP